MKTPHQSLMNRQTEGVGGADLYPSNPTTYLHYTSRKGDLGPSSKVRKVLACCGSIDFVLCPPLHLGTKKNGEGKIYGPYHENYLIYGSSFEPVSVPTRESTH